MTLKEFLERSKTRDNQWVVAPNLSVYLRKGQRYFGDLVLTSFEIASIEVEESHRGQGCWKKFIAEIQAYNLSQDIIFVENVLTDQFADWFRKNGWNEDKRTPVPSFWTPTEQTH